MTDQDQAARRVMDQDSAALRLLAKDAEIKRLRGLLKEALESPRYSSVWERIQKEVGR